ncbi:MAG TPA: class I SAM-dependent methyltransferase [Polyangiaceae bacterium]|nr:class I SAM-dependent methyltransferase [Polyangiaceae bacterium]
MSRTVGSAASEEEALRANLAFYGPLWEQSRLVSPERFNTWPLVHSLLALPQSRLEVGPGLRPRLPLEGTRFVDASAPAVAKLRRHGARAEVGLITELPYDDGVFDLVAAFDIVEHVDDDDAAFSELSRVAAPRGRVLLSAPLHPSRWSAFDTLVGHRRRYEPAELLAKLARHGLSVRSTAAYGMQPRSSRLLDLGVWGLTHRREKAIWWYDRVMLGIGTRLQKKLTVVPGMIDVSNVDEILLTCRKSAAPSAGDAPLQGAG